MIADGTYTVVLDHFEETQEDRVAVLVVEDGEQPLDDLLVDPADLPEEACYVNAVLEVTIEDDRLWKAIFKETESRDRQEGAQSQFDRLSQRPPSDDET